MFQRYFLVIRWVLLAFLVSACGLMQAPVVERTLLPDTMIIAATCEPANCPTCAVNCPTCPSGQVTHPESLTGTAMPVTDTATFTPTYTFTATETLVPTFTPTFTQTSTVTNTPKPKPYQVQPSSPVYMQNIYHSDQGCNWMGIGGLVLNTIGEPVNKVVVVVEGILEGRRVDELSLTSIAPNFGSGGYEIILSDHVIESTDTLMITLYDLDGVQLSNPFVFSTYGDCSKNLIIINFQQVYSP